MTGGAHGHTTKATLTQMKINKLQFVGTNRFIARIRAMARWRIRPISAALLMIVLSGCGRNAPPSVSGVVLGEDTGKPIANALVLVSSPAIDMRTVRGNQPGLTETRTDAKGRFNVQVPKNEKISLNAFTPGYEEAAGMWMSGLWILHNVPFPSGHGQEFTIKLQPALYVAGIVTDESGRPFSEASVTATISDESSTAYVAFDTTEANGRFQIFDFPLKPEDVSGNANAHGQLIFSNPIKLTSIIQNVYALSEAERTNLHVTLSSGHEVKGIITSAAGQPLAQAVVEAVHADKEAARRKSMTDAHGRFVVRGLPDGEITLRAHSTTFDQTIRTNVQLAGADAEVNLRMEPVVLKNPPKPVNLLGMKLADVTPELQAVYDLYAPTGVLILDPGTNDLWLGPSVLKGERFWLVGDRQITNLSEMVAELLRIDAIAPPGDPNEGCHGSIRVVYDLPGADRTYTTRLKLTEKEVAELKNWDPLQKAGVR